MKLGIVGLPNVGKSTLFNALTNAGAAAENYPFCTIEPNVGVVAVPDARLDALEKMHQPEKVTHAVVEFVDIAGLVKGASQGEGLGNKFLSHIREVDAILHTVRCFENGDIVHVDGSIDPVRDIETIQLELILSDIELVGRRIDRSRKMAKADKKFEADAELFEALKAHLEDGHTASSFSCDEAGKAAIAELPLLSNKRVLYAANMSEEDFRAGYASNAAFLAVKEFADAEGSAVIPVCARIEQEIAELDDEDKAMFLEELGLESSGLDRLIRASYDLLGLISYLTAGKPEVRAWTIKKGTRAPQAAGVIHSDFEKGFIRAEVIGFDELMAVGSMTTAKERGLIRSEGKEYVMRDGDIVLFRFNV